MAVPEGAAQTAGFPHPDESFPFGGLTELPADPILGLSADFIASKHPQKQNLGPGVYMNETGVTPVLASIREAAGRLEQRPHNEGYLPIDGLSSYVNAVQRLTFGSQSSVLDRVASVQSPGGTAAVCIAAHLSRRLLDARPLVAIPSPTWPNHRGIFAELGFTVAEYPYYNPVARSVDIDATLTFLSSLPQSSVVVLHACCHNPTGKDFTASDWDRLTKFFSGSSHIPLIDFAYQGFKHGLEEDAAPIRRFIAQGIPSLIAVSLSKSFSLYSQRVGALHVVTRSPAEQRATLSHLKQIVRCIYSNPPSRGAQLVSEVLSDASLEATWRSELESMRTRIAGMRQALADGMKSRGFDFSHVCDQYGMFSFTGISPSAVRTLKDRHAIFMTDNGRISVPALNPSNINYICDSFAEVLRGPIS